MKHLRVPATSANVGPGFDTLGLAFEWFLECYFTKLPENGTLEMEIEGFGKKYIPVTKENIIYKAYARVFKYKNIETYGLKININNSVPIARGMGSSSSAIVMGILVANSLLNNILTQDELLQLAYELEGHTDNITAALLGGFITSGVVNGQVKAVKFNIPGNLICTLIVPDYELSTVKARKVLPSEISFKDAVQNNINTSMIVSSLSKGDLKLFSQFLTDYLSQPYRAPLVKGITKIQEIARDCGFLGACISGAGPTIILFTEKNKSTDLEPIKKILKDEKINFTIYKDINFINYGGLDLLSKVR
ncbi:homoserine kinase [Candidatus Epulonipiscium fishelsonii]|uniref:Homoserine kinase n=1 Tax=Candidatus Epulonipiscium fishelsonii TaxID=77094 RepID=A0ACC8XHQ0_9FIRM|nr:homoserine kinase [Epulopiscium sp. SCG-D08WGA-EpuloA1]